MTAPPRWWTSSGRHSLTMLLQTASLICQQGHQPAQRVTASRKPARRFGTQCGVVQIHLPGDQPGQQPPCHQSNHTRLGHGIPPRSATARSAATAASRDCRHRQSMRADAGGLPRRAHPQSACGSTSPRCAGSLSGGHTDAAAPPHGLPGRAAEAAAATCSGCATCTCMVGSTHRCRDGTGARGGECVVNVR